MTEARTEWRLAEAEKRLDRLDEKYDRLMAVTLGATITVATSLVVFVLTINWA